VGRSLNSDLLQGFYLDDLLIEPLKGQVTDRAGSRHLPPKAVEVLLCLARKPGDLVSREDLLNAVWGSDHGSQEALSHAISEIRHALDDHPDNPHYIQTLRRRGYRLAVRPVPTDENSASIVLGAGNDAQLSSISLLENLKRRGVLETALAYLIVGWLLIQIADIVFSQLHLPDWAATFVTVFVIAGFPIAIILSWFLEYRDGRTVVDEVSPIASRRRRFGRTYVSVIAGLAFASVLVFVYDRNFGLPVAVLPEAAPTDATLTLPPVTKNSIAVLPFFNIDGSEDTQTFANGLVDDVITRLSRVPNLRVSSRGDSFTLEPNSASAQVRRRLRVALYLEGSVQIADDQIRVIVQLIDSETGFHVVARTFNRLRKDFFDIRDEITELTVANVRVALPAGEQVVSTPAWGEPNLDAYVLYRRGVDASRLPTTKAMANAIRWYDEALEVDADFAAAHAGKCTAYVGRHLESGDATYIGDAESACALALQLNPNLDAVHTALGNLYKATGRYDGALAEFQQALESDPNSVGALTGLGAVYGLQRKPLKAEEILRRAVGLRPGDWSPYNYLGSFLYAAGRYAEAAEQFEYVVALDSENMIGYSNLGTTYMLADDFSKAAPALRMAISIDPRASTYSNLGLMYYYLGDFSEAIEAHRHATELSPSDPANWSNLGDALWIAGRSEDARETFESAATLADAVLEINPNDPYTQMDMAWINAMLDKSDDARELINRALSRVPEDPYAHYIDGLINLRNGDSDAALDALEIAAEKGYSRKMMAAEPHLVELRPYPRFQNLIKATETP
jgi:tetratricopeptide (TPR) repeat protein/DNA-binding winged helix-turn-helix (wHTH) protein